MKSVLIAGAGVIGLATALELATRGVEVTVLERGTAMREASWAAAGMLAAYDPENPSMLAPLSQLSLSLYPDFLRRVEQLSGVRVPLRTSATLQLYRPEHVPGRLPASAKILSQGQALQRVPGLAAELPGNLLWLEEWSLDPRDLGRALPAAVRAAGVELVEHCTIHEIRAERDRVTATTSSADQPNRYIADGMVACCGAWSLPSLKASLDPEQTNLSLCVPRKGQMLAVRMPQRAGIPVLRTVLRSPEVYLVPRGHPFVPAASDAGRTIIGATVEDAGFDRSIRPEATAWLLEKAAALWPEIRHAEIEDVWTGIRPGTVDGLPLIGPVASGLGPSRMWLATGHYRNGILLAPGTAHVVATSLLENQVDACSIDLDPFRPSRPAPRSSEDSSRTPSFSDAEWMPQIAAR